MKYKTLYVLFKVFFKIGLFTFGGGYSMLPFIEKEICEKHKFLPSDELLDMFSISECTPGPVSINCATFIGYKLHGVLGSTISTLGIILPSFIIIILISMFLYYFREIGLINNFLGGIKVGVILLLIESIIKLNSKVKKSKYHYVIIPLILFVCLFTNISTIIILCISITVNILIISIRRGNKK